MRSSGNRQRSAAWLLSLLTAVGLSIPGYVLAAPTGPEQEGAATRQLFAAVQTNDFQAVQTSIAAGADVEARNPWGDTAADVAVDKGYFRIAHYLVSIRNFQRSKTEAAPSDARAALTQAKPPVPSSATVAAASSPKAVPPAGSRVAAVPSSPPASTAAVASPPPAGHGQALVRTTTNGADPFDPSRPAYGANLPTTSDNGS